MAPRPTSLTPVAAEPGPGALPSLLERDALPMTPGGPCSPHTRGPRVESRMLQACPVEPHLDRLVSVSTRESGRGETHQWPSRVGDFDIVRSRSARYHRSADLEFDRPNLHFSDIPVRLPGDLQIGRSCLHRSGTHGCCHAHPGWHGAVCAHRFARSGWALVTARASGGERRDAGPNKARSGGDRSREGRHDQLDREPVGLRASR
jgi:hypothetical protein